MLNQLTLFGFRMLSEPEIKENSDDLKPLLSEFSVDAIIYTILSDSGFKTNQYNFF
ncbi:MAG: hypothetical protein ABI792_02685 [bacterium]